MRALKFPTADLPCGLEALKTALGDSRALTLAEEKSLLALYGDYEAAGGLAHLLVPDPNFNGPRGGDLREAYKQTHSSGRLASVRMVLVKLAENRCPSCGSGRPTELDHHAPKTGFAEFSLYLKNLVCSCDGCNRKKSSHNPKLVQEALLHPYFDPIPDVPFISVAIDLTEASVTAELYFDDQAAIADPILKARMKYQFSKIDVNLQVGAEVSEVIREESDTIDGEIPNPTSGLVADYLNRRAERFANRHGGGFWKAALLRALAAHSGFCDGGYKVMLLRTRWAAESS